MNSSKPIVFAPELYTPRMRISKHDQHIRENFGVDPAILATELGVTESFIRLRQRKLGLRKCTYSPRKADRKHTL